MSGWKVGILIFDGVELLDFAGPLEVFSAARSLPDAQERRPPFDGWHQADAPFQVFTVAKARSAIATSAGLTVQPDVGFADHPAIDVLVVPGGRGVRTIINDPPDKVTLDWLTAIASRTTVTSSVCTGAWLLARAGLLRNRRATTHFLCLDRLRELDATITIAADQRVVEDGRIITSAGVAAGLDMALHVIAKLCGRPVAHATARYIEYPFT